MIDEELYCGNFALSPQPFSDGMAHLTHSSSPQFSYPSSLLTDVLTTLSPTKSARSGQRALAGSRKRTSSSNLGGPCKRSAQITDALPQTIIAQPSAPGLQQACSSYEIYMEAVVANCAGFYRVSNEFFVVQGWDTRRESASVGFYCFVNLR